MRLTPEPLAVAFALSVTAPVVLLILAIVVPAAMPAPNTGKPTLRLTVLATGTVIEFELLVVVAAMVVTAGKPVPVTISP